MSAHPNILYIMSDDHAAHAISAYGSQINHTPHIDRLADQGVRLTNTFCTNALCTPSRATILTGQYSHVNEVKTLDDEIDSSRPIQSQKLLKQAGYDTAIVGKWHLGNNEESSIVTSVIEDKSTNNMIKDVLQFLISPNFINQHLNTFIEVAERYLKLKFDIDTGINVRHNVVKYICCRGKLEQFIPENIICKYLKPGIHRIDDNVFFSIIYCLLNNNNNNIKDNNDFIFESFVKHGKELMVEYGGIMDMNILKQVKPPCRSLIGKILHFQKSKSNHQSSDWFDLVLQEDHNPKFNGIEILLTLNKHKAAYMLMEIGENYLCFRGIRILERFRRRGLTSTLLKVWLLLCTVLKKIPTTIKMNKPLLCIALLNLGLIPNIPKPSEITN